jgi:hypothetical protein
MTHFFPWFDAGGDLQEPRGLIAGASRKRDSRSHRPFRRSTLCQRLGIYRVLDYLPGPASGLPLARMEEELLRVRSVLEACSLCGVYKFKTRKLISGARQTWICDGCVTLARRVLDSGAAQADKRARLEPADPDARCQFCGQGARPTGGRLVTGGGTNICAICVDLCDKILTEDYERGS